VSKALSIDRAVDGNLKPVKDSDGTLTALEVSTDTVRVKNLVVAGKVEGSLEVDTITAKADFTLDVAGNITIDADGGAVTITDTTPSSYVPSFKLLSTDASVGGALMQFQQDSASPADGDNLGGIYFQGDDAGGNVTGYVSIIGSIESPIGGSEEGKLTFAVMDGVGSHIGYSMSGNAGVVNVNVGYGTGSVTTIAGDATLGGTTLTFPNGAILSNPIGNALYFTGEDGYAFRANAGASLDFFFASNNAAADADRWKIVIQNGSKNFELWNSAGGGYVELLELTTDGDLTIAGDLDIDGDAITTEGAITLDSGGAITLDAHDGSFVAKKAGDEFSVANSAYAGMILGYRTIGVNVAHATFPVQAIYGTINSDMTVRFIAPPSGTVEVEFQINYNTGTSASVNLHFGLSDAATYNRVADEYEQLVHEGARFQTYIPITHKFIVPGLIAGDTYNYWLGARVSSVTGTPLLQWGGSSTGRYQDFVMKVTALPAATADFAVYG